MASGDIFLYHATRRNSIPYRWLSIRVRQSVVSESRLQQGKGFRKAFLVRDEIEDDSMGAQSRPGNEESYDRGNFQFLKKEDGEGRSPEVDDKRFQKMKFHVYP